MEEATTPSPDTNPSPFTNNPFLNPHSQGFSFDNIPPSKWFEKLYDIHAWCTTEMLVPHATLQTIITKCVARFIGRLRQWYLALGEYRQLQFKQVPTLSTFIEVFHNEFLGSSDIHKSTA
ncbi:hypothetical protein U1Q18_052478 [Sarracenia purpurea var. burkii]